MSDASQVVVLFVYGSLFVVLIIIVIILLVFLTRHKTRNYELRLQEVQQQFEQETMKTKLELQEEVLTKVSGEIHDHIGQVLAGVALALQSLETEKLTERGTRIVDGSVQRVITATEELRNLSHLMSGTKVEGLGLIEALRRELEFLSLTKKLHVKYHHCDRQAFPAISRPAIILLFRIAQEAIKNVINHASAGLLEVTIDYLQNMNTLVMTVSDDGKGLPQAYREGMGLSSMKQRASLLNAQLEIGNSSLGGTLVTIKLKTEYNADKNNHRHRG